MTKILILLTNHATLGPEKEPNGTYSPEFTHAVSEFQKAGMPFDLASPQGGPVPFYGQDSDDATDTAVHADSGVQAQLATTMAVKDVDPAAYDAIFYPGGFGLLYDLATDATAAGITAEVYARGGVVGAVCHGPAGFLPVTLSDGSALLDGKSVTGFTREEEIDFETIDKIPFLLEEALTRKAGKYAKVAPWAEHVVADDRVVTGQNPASASGVAKAMISALGANSRDAA